jgi:hypothetical protein
MIDHIEIPGEYVSLAARWYSGQDDLLYAVSSTGGLTTGGQRPSYQGDDRNWLSMTDEEWYLSLWVGLSSDVHFAIKAARKRPHEDLDDLVQFQTFVDKTVEDLRAEYHLEDSDVV